MSSAAFVLSKNRSMQAADHGIKMDAALAVCLLFIASVDAAAIMMEMIALQGGQSYQCRQRETLILTQLLLAWLTSGFICIVSAIPTKLLLSTGIPAKTSQFCV